MISPAIAAIPASQRAVLRQALADAISYRDRAARDETLAWSRYGLAGCASPMGTTSTRYTSFASRFMPDSMPRTNAST
jgi:hypothetical protein